ncbi:MAG: biotin transporter BioY [Streptococcaceae bacterium]|nr:biotin transporter BioY [Streptococcaceae bacterium]
MKNNTFSMLLIALGTALIAIASQLAIPFGAVPFTLQTLVVALLASLYRLRELFLSVLLYLLLGGIGFPIFSAGSSGLAVLFGPTGGFLLAFLLSGSLIAVMIQFFGRRVPSLAVANLLGLILTLLIGTIWLKFFYQMKWEAAFVTGFLPFVAAEIIKAVIVSLLATALYRALPRINSYFKEGK